MTAVLSPALRQGPASASESLERSTYFLSCTLGSFFVASTRVIHHWLDPEAIDPLTLRIVVCGALLAAAITAKRGSTGAMRAAAVGSMCLVNLYAGWITGINELDGPWPHAFFTAFISTSLIIGPFSPSPRSAAIRVVAMTLCLGVGCISQLADASLGITATIHAGIVGTFVALMSIMHIRTRVKLVGARDRALDATRAKAQFLANMSHEIRTPMNGVLGTASLLDDGTLREDQRELVHTLNASGEALIAIINDILDLSKIESGAIELESAAFDFAELLTGTAALIKPVAEAGGLDLKLSLDGIPPLVIGDAFRTRQVVTNLLSNATKFTEEGAIELEGRWSDGTMTVCVRDSGIGIEAERLRDIFESFRQADESTTRRFGGTGLGLTISREIVSRMGGEIEVRSEVGVGSEFILTIPLQEAPAVPEAGGGPESKDEAERTVEPGPAGLAEAPKSLRILLVDDNPVNRRVACKILERLGHSADQATDGLEAVAAAEANDYEIILMDVQMPNLDGLGAMRQIRAFPSERPRPWIIALTAGATPEDREATRQAGADEHVTKPIRVDDLRKALGRRAKHSFVTEASESSEARAA
ncbi:MAG: ATP-binding protein [Planctomycetota bacterium]